MDHLKAERVIYQNGIRDFWSFGQSETPKVELESAAVLSRMEFSSDVKTQNSVTPNPLSGQRHMSNR
jgi:hypothetical protein